MQVGTTSLSSVCGVTGAHALRLQLYVEANFDAHFRNYRKHIAAETRQIDDGGGRLLRRFCNEMELFEAEAVYRRCPKNLQTLKKKTPLEPLLFDADCLLEGGKSNSEAVGNLVKLIPFSSHRNGRWRRMWRSWLLEDPTVDRFVAISRWKIRQRLNRMVGNGLDKYAHENYIIVVR